MVLRIKEDTGIRTAKLFINNKEIIFCPRIVLSGALSIGLRIEVIIVVWVTPLVSLGRWPWPGSVRTGYSQGQGGGGKDGQSSFN